MSAIGNRKLLGFLACIVVFVAIFVLLIFKASIVDNAFVMSLSGLSSPLSTGIGALYLLLVGGNAAVHIFGKKDNSTK